MVKDALKHWEFSMESLASKWDMVVISWFLALVMGLGA